mgnify:CR=1 FL=1
MEVNFYEMYLEEMALIPVLEAEEEENSYDGVDLMKLWLPCRMQLL